MGACGFAAVSIAAAKSAIDWKRSFADLAIARVAIESHSGDSSGRLARKLGLTEQQK